LQRVGVSFTDTQKDQIKAMVEAGDTMGAQKLILAELSKEFGGSAQAAAETYDGRMAQLHNSIGDLKETIGSAFIPVLNRPGRECIADGDGSHGKAGGMAG